MVKFSRVRTTKLVGVLWSSLSVYLLLLVFLCPISLLSGLDVLIKMIICLLSILSLSGLLFSEEMKLIVNKVRLFKFIRRILLHFIVVLYKKVFALCAKRFELLITDDKVFWTDDTCGFKECVVCDWFDYLISVDPEEVNKYEKS